MSAARVNMADPSFEPSDEDLTRLSREAFADIARQRREADEKLWRTIAELRSRVREEMQERRTRQR